MTSQLLSTFTDKMRQPPLSDRRESGANRDLSDPVSVLMLVIDFRLENLWNGIIFFIGNPTGAYASETVGALKRIGCDAAAERLARILTLAADAGLTHEALQQDRDLLDTEIDAIRELETELNRDCVGIPDAQESYFAKHQTIFQAALTGKAS
ncbi:MAG: hypothetical protein H8E37_03985 [Planctomycetes bacterium]|nr:hypothetical protein [Planctomycetota bacterium]